jgi:AlwI restriction endonuclease
MFEELENFYCIWNDIFHNYALPGKRKVSINSYSLKWDQKLKLAPKALGFVDLKPTISLTEAGKKLLTGKRINETITKQLLKFQVPSPYHKTNRLNVKPYLEFLRLVKTVGSLSKTETALFFLQITRYDKFEEIVQKIYDFREKREVNKGNWKVFVANCFEIEINKIFKFEIQSGKVGTRESVEKTYKKFIKTKKS